MTDILLASATTWPTGVFADPMTAEVRAAWYSLAFWLRLAAGAELDIDPLELQAGFRSRSDGTRPVGEAFLSDQLENGAGYCRELARAPRFQALLREADPSPSANANPGQETLAAKWMDTTTRTALAAPHALECDTSCNRCLRDFQNLPYHGLLDWRLALDMARILASPAAIVDLASQWSSAVNPWMGLVEGAQAPIPGALAGLGYAPPELLGTLRVYARTQGRKRVLIERHPLWQDDHPEYQAAFVAAAARYPGITPEPLNPYRMLRRPADYV
jgi:hypothetical protein